jgi:hypothetical protein
MFNKDELDLIDVSLASFIATLKTRVMDYQKIVDPVIVDYVNEQKAMLEEAKSLRSKMKFAKALKEDLNRYH